MARRRLNTKFVVILGAAVVMLAVAGYFVRRRILRTHPEQYQAAAAQAEAAHHWKDAVDEMNAAVSAAPRDPKLRVEYGNDLNEYGKENLDIIRRHQNLDQWDLALEIDPKFAPAIKALAMYWRQGWEQSPDARTYRNARDRAAQLLTAAPNDPDAADFEVFLHTMTIRGSIKGLETDQALIRQSEESLVQLEAKNASNADLPYCLAELAIHRAQVAILATTDARQPASATAQFKIAQDLMTKALAGQDKNGEMHYFAAKVYRSLSDLDQSAPDGRAKNMAAAQKEMDRAIEMVKVDDKRYLEITIEAALLAESQANMPKAHQIMAGFVKEEMSDPITLGRGSSALLRDMPELRPQVIKAIRDALDADSQSVEVTLHRFNLLAPLVDLEISELKDTTGETAKKTLSDQITLQLKQLDSSGINHLYVVREEGRFYQSSGNFVTAVQVLGAATSSDPAVGNDLEVLWMLAQSYNQVNERAQALDYSKRIVGGFPEFVPARIMLVTLLAPEGTEEARRQINQHLSYLMRAMPDDPTVLRLQIMQLDPQADADRIKTLYDKLPEKNAQQMTEKGIVALSRLGGRAGDETVRKNEDALRKNEVIRLFSNAVKADSADTRLVMRLVQAQAMLGLRADAMATVERALTLHPNDPDLQLTLKQLSDASPEALLALQKQLDTQTSDPLERELALAQHAMAANNLTETQQHVDAADKLSPDNSKVLDLKFKLAAAQGQWDKMPVIVKKLGDQNADQANGLLYQFMWAAAQQDTPREITVGQQLAKSMPEFAMSYFCLGQAYQAAGQYQLAIANYDTAISKKGVDVEASGWLKRKIECFYLVGQPEKAIQAIDLGRRQYPSDNDFRALKIQHEASHNDWDGAVLDLKDLRDVQIGSGKPLAGTYLDLASAQMQVAIQKLQAGNTFAADTNANAARDTINDALKIFPDDIRLYKQLSDILRHNGDNLGAEKALTDARDRPLLRREFEPQRLLGRFYVATGQPAKGEAALTESFKLAPDDKKADVQVELAQLLAGEGATLLRDKKTAEANDKFNQALGVLQAGGAANKLIHKERVNVLVQAGRVNDAEAEIKQIVPDGPAEQSELETGFAQMELNAGHPDMAVQHVNIALTANPRNGSALNMRAQLKMAQAKPDIQGALVDLDMAHQIQPNDIGLLVEIANVEIQAGDYGTSTKALDAALQLDPSNFTLRNRLASNYAQYAPQQLDKALAVLQDGMSQPSGSTNPDLFNNIANVYQQMGKNDKALETVTTAMQRIPRDTNGYLSLVRNFLRLSLEAQNYQQVIDSAGTLLKQRDDLWWAWQSRGLANARLGQRNINQVLKDAAMTDMLKALDAAKDFPDQVQVVMAISHDIDSAKAIDLVQARVATDQKWTTMLILLYHQVGQDDQAIKLLGPMMQGLKDLPPASQVARLQLAGSIYATAQPKPYPQEAYDTYKKLLALTPKDVQALNNFACVCADDFQPPKVTEGLDAIKTAIDLLRNGNSSDPRVDDTYGWLLILSGQTTNGMDAIRRAVAHSDFPEAHYHLGEGYLRLNNPQSAQTEITAAYQSISKAQESNEPVSSATKTNLADLNKRVLDSQKLRATGSVP